MKIAKYITEDSVLVLERAADKQSLLAQMSEVLQRRIDEDGVGCHLFEKILQREKVSSTGIGNGFACPHARLEGLEEPYIAIALLREPVDFKAHDMQGVSLVCMIAAPENNPTVALQIMSQLCKSYNEAANTSALKCAKDSRELYRYLRGLDMEVDVPVTAAQIMHPPPYLAQLNTPLRELTANMAKHHLSAVAVVDDDGRIKGHITCSVLFNFGLPDFFSKLKSVSFISEFNPFEKYFFEEAHSRAEDLAVDTYMAVDEEATLLEIVFALTTLRHPMIYVLREGRVCGIIDQETVLAQIVNI